MPACGSGKLALGFAGSRRILYRPVQDGHRRSRRPVRGAVCQCVAGARFHRRPAAAADLRGLFWRCLFRNTPSGPSSGNCFRGWWPAFCWVVLRWAGSATRRRNGPSAESCSPWWRCNSGEQDSADRPLRLRVAEPGPSAKQDRTECRPPPTEQEFPELGPLGVLAEKGNAKKVRADQQRQRAPVESRAGNALANSATDRTPRPATPVLDRPVKGNPPAASKAQCQFSRSTGRHRPISPGNRVPRIIVAGLRACDNGTRSAPGRKNRFRRHDLFRRAGETVSEFSGRLVTWTWMVSRPLFFIRKRSCL